MCEVLADLRRRFHRHEWTPVTSGHSGADLNSQFGQSYEDRFFATYGEPAPDPQRLYFYRLLDEFF